MGKLTPAEERAVRSLERLAKSWPKSLMLFSNSGTLYVRRNDHTDQPWLMSSIVTSIQGIPNDGGDADWRKDGDG